MFSRTGPVPGDADACAATWRRPRCGRVADGICPERRWRCVGGVLGVALAAFASGAAAALPLRVVDNSGRADGSLILRLDETPGAWWLELADTLVVVGGSDESLDAGARARVTLALPEVDPDLLRLRARGCSEHADNYGRVLARGGRWELRLLSESERALLDAGDAHGWMAVPRDVSVARRYRAAAGATDPAVQAVVARVDAVRWFADVRTLSSWDRHSHATDSLQQARDWIAAQFGALGLEVEMQSFEMPGPGGTLERDNVVATWHGSLLPARSVIVGAHYDSRSMDAASLAPTPGAEDNASGCAGVIELARALLPSRPARSIHFMCYAGEEQGLRGSRAHVQALQADLALERIDAVVIMDMIGYSADGQLEALFESSSANADYLARFGAAAAAYVPGLAVVTSTFPFGSDHVPYIDAGLRSALAIQNDWDIYPHYHRSTDLPVNMGPHVLAMGGAILATNAAVIAEVGGLYTDPFRDGFEDRP